MALSLSDRDREAFYAAFSIEAFGHIDPNDSDISNLMMWENLQPVLQKKVGGRTAQEIIDATHGKYKEELRDTYLKLLRLEKNTGFIEKVKIDNLSFRDKDLTLPRVFFDIENNTKEVITSIDGNIKIQTPGRALPWLEGSLYENFRGGIERGEKRTVESLIYVETTSKPDIPDDVEVLVEIERIRGLDDKTLYDINSDPEKRKSRIKTLKAMLE